MYRGFVTNIEIITSSEKLTWPGVSKTLMRYDFSLRSLIQRVSGVDFMLSPLSLSVSSVSVYRTDTSSFSLSNNSTSQDVQNKIDFEIVER